MFLNLFPQRLFVLLVNLPPVTPVDLASLPGENPPIISPFGVYAVWFDRGSIFGHLCDIINAFMLLVRLPFPSPYSPYRR